MHYSPDIITAQDALERAALRSLMADRYPGDSDPHADATSEWADELLALAARRLVDAVEALPLPGRPTGWDAEVPA